MIVAMVIVIIVGIGLGMFTAYLSDVSYLAPEKSMKEFAAGLGVLIFGIFTTVTVGGVLTIFGFLITGLTNPKLLKG